MADAPKVWNKRDPNVPEGAVYVGRPTKWGNPFVIGSKADPEDPCSFGRTRLEVVQAYRDYLRYVTSGIELGFDAKRELRGKHLVCWCAPKPCHADVLLEIAND